MIIGFNCLIPYYLISRYGRNRAKPAKGHLEELRTNDRWLVVSDDQKLEYACSLVDVAFELEWRTLVVGKNVTCCR